MAVRPAPASSLLTYEIISDAIPKSLTGTPGDPARGRAVLVKRESTCLLCHSGPFPDQRFQGNLSPDLTGVGSRWSEGELRLRMVDASHLNADTIMPSLLQDRWSDPGGTEPSRQAGVDRTGDRRRRRLSDHAEGLTKCWTSLPARDRHVAFSRRSRCTDDRAAGRRDTGRRWPPRSVRLQATLPSNRARSSSTCPARRERQFGGDDRQGRQPDDGQRSCEGDPYLHRKEPVAECHQRQARPARPARPNSRRASASPTQQVVAICGNVRRLILVRQGRCDPDAQRLPGGPCLMAARTLVNVPPKAKRGEVIRSAR